MDMKNFFKSVIDSDVNPVVICDTEHTVVYLNPAASLKYEKDGNVILGRSILSCHNARSNELIVKILEWFKESKDNNSVHTYYSEKENKDVYVVALRDGTGNLIGYYEKHEIRSQDKTPFYLTV